MQGDKRETWEKRCQRAADEKDPDRLMELVRQINALLEEKEQRLQLLRQG